MRAIVFLVAAALVLSGCKGNQKKETGGVAQGEILPGAISDAMLPLDTVKSQPPLAPKSESGGKPASKEAEDSPAAPSSPSDAPPAPAGPAAQ